VKVSLKRSSLLLSLAAIALPAAIAQAQAPKVAVRLDPATTEIRWKLSGVPHSVHGTFHLKGGLVTLDPATTVAAGELLVDLSSGESGNKERDAKMQKDILQSDKYPEAFFRPAKITGSPEAFILKSSATQTVEAEGTFNIHGADHPLVLKIEVKLDGDKATAATHFTVPYVEWGMKNPSHGLLRVGKSVDVEIVAYGTVESSDQK
jgi:polyisoprenoid-binding protein YceI